MKISTKKKAKKDRYLELVQCVPLRPIRSESELGEAINMVNYLIDQVDRAGLNADEKDYLDVLADLIEKYEDEHIVFKRQPDSEMLRFLIEAKGVTQTQVSKECRIAESTISAILSGQRKPNRNHIAKFAAYFHVAPTVFSFDV
jgi:HTH-type transcriptional regulator/antitoxin HigA